MQLPPGNDFHATWAFLEEGLDQIMCRFEQGLDRTRYSILYRYVSIHYIKVLNLNFNLLTRSIVAVLYIIIVQEVIPTCITIYLLRVYLIHEDVTHLFEIL